MFRKMLFIFCFIAPSASWAHYSTMDTGDLLELGHYRVQAETQFVTNEDTGANFLGYFDTGLNEESNLRFLAGFGTTDFQIGGFYKWVPIPDYQDQPAIGMSAGLTYAQYEGHNELSIRIHPLVSKGFEVNFGKLTPYASLPFGLRSYDDDTDIPLQLAVGSEAMFNEISQWRFKAEAGFDLVDAFTYISIGASLEFDEENGFSF